MVMITNYNTSQAAKLWRVELLKGYSSPCSPELMLPTLLVFDGVGDFVASDANDFETEHRIYHEDAVLEYPQSGERTRGRRNIQNQRASQPSKKRSRTV
jgi:hypothetical protein